MHDEFEDKLGELADRLGKAACKLYPRSGPAESSSRLISQKRAQGRLEEWLEILEDMEKWNALDRLDSDYEIEARDIQTLGNGCLPLGPQ